MNPYSIIYSPNLRFFQFMTSELLHPLFKSVSLVVDGIKIPNIMMSVYGSKIKEFLPYFENKTIIFDTQITQPIYHNEILGTDYGLGIEQIDVINFLSSSYNNIFITLNGLFDISTLSRYTDYCRQLEIKTLLTTFESDFFYNYKIGTSKDERTKIKQNLEMIVTQPLKLYESLFYVGESSGVDGYICPIDNKEILHFCRRFSNKLIASSDYSSWTDPKKLYDWALEAGKNSLYILELTGTDPVIIQDFLKNTVSIKKAALQESFNDFQWEKEGESKKSILNWRNTDRWIQEAHTYD